MRLATKEIQSKIKQLAVERADIVSRDFTSNPQVAAVMSKIDPTVREKIMRTVIDQAMDGYQQMLDILHARDFSEAQIEGYLRFIYKRYISDGTDDNPEYAAIRVKVATFVRDHPELHDSLYSLELKD